MMKKYIWSIIIAFTALACADEDYNSAFHDYVGMNSQPLPAKVLEDAAGVKIPIIYGGNVTNGTAFNVAYEVTGGEYGVNYTIEGASGPSGVVNIKAGKIGTEAIGYINIKSIPDFDTEADVPLTVTLKSVDNANVRLGYPYKTVYNVVLANDDCDYVIEQLSGTAASVETYEDGSTYGPYDTNFEVTSENHITIDNFYDAGTEVELIYHPEDRTVEVVSNVFNDGTDDWDISGSGKLNTCDNSVSITFALKTTVFGGFDGALTINYAFPEPE